MVGGKAGRQRCPRGETACPPAACAQHLAVCDEGLSPRPGHLVLTTSQCRRRGTRDCPHLQTRAQRLWETCQSSSHRPRRGLKNGGLGLRHRELAPVRSAATASLCALRQVAYLLGAGASSSDKHRGWNRKPARSFSSWLSSRWRCSGSTSEGLVTALDPRLYPAPQETISGQRTLPSHPKATRNRLKKGVCFRAGEIHRRHRSPLGPSCALPL